MLRMRSVAAAGDESVEGTLRSKEEEKRQMRLGASERSKDRTSILLPFFFLLSCAMGFLAAASGTLSLSLSPFKSLFSLFFT